MTISVLETNLNKLIFSVPQNRSDSLQFIEKSQKIKSIYMWHVRKFFRQYLALQLSIGLGWTLPPPPKKNDV